MNPIAFLYLLPLTGILLAAYIPGRLFLNLTVLSSGKQAFYAAFLALFLGFIMLAAGVAAYATGFKTVLSLYFILLLALLYFYRRPDFNFRHIYHNIFSLKLLILPVGALILFSSAAMALSGNEVFGFVFPWRDNMFYALLSNHIFNTGAESFYLNANLIHPAAAKPVPYHYFEFWLNAAVSELFGGLYFLNLMLVTATALRLLIFAGLLATWETYFTRVNWLGILICFQLVFLQGIVLPVYAQMFPDVPIIQQLSVNAEGLKFLTGYFFFLGFLNTALRRHWLAAALFLAAYPVAHILALPGILAGAGGLFLLYCFRTEIGGLMRRRALTAGLVLAAGILLLGLFYVLLGGHQSGTRTQNVLQIVQTFRPDDLKPIYQAFKHNAIRFFIVTWPFFLLLLPVYFLNRKRPQLFTFSDPAALVLLFAGFALFGGALLSSLLYQSIEGHQPLQILMPLLNLSLSLALIIALKKAGSWHNLLARFSLFAGVALLLFFSYNPIKNLFRPGGAAAQNMPYQNYGANYLNQIARLFHSGEIKPLGSCILGPKDLDYYYGYSPLHYTLGLYLPYITNNYFVFSLSEFFTPYPEDPYLREQARDETEAGAFYKFVKAQKAAEEFKSINQSQLDFIREYQLGYVIISPDAPSNPLLEKQAKRIFQDPQSGEKFLSF